LPRHLCRLASLASTTLSGRPTLHAAVVLALQLLSEVSITTSLIEELAL
jgi:hypothetical protein